MASARASGFPGENEGGAAQLLKSAPDMKSPQLTVVIPVGRPAKKVKYKILGEILFIGFFVNLEALIYLF
jgi:hypothetical protein